MKKYYYSTDGKNKVGPFTLEELKRENISGEYLVWREGLTDWAKAKDVSEISSCLVSSPPPLPGEIEAEKLLQAKEEHELIKSNENNYGITLLGVILLIFWLAIVLFLKDADGSDARGVIAFCGLFLKVIVTFAVVSKASELNRNQVNWGLLGFFFPSVSLIVIGLLKKKIIQIEKNQSSRELLTKAMAFYADQRFDDCANCCLVVIQRDEDFQDFIEVRVLLVKALFELGLYERSRNGLLRLLELNYNQSVVLYSIGLTYLAQDNRKMAKEYFQRSAEAGFAQKEYIEKLAGLRDDQTVSSIKLPNKL